MSCQLLQFSLYYVHQPHQQGIPCFLCFHFRIFRKNVREPPLFVFNRLLRARLATPGADISQASWSSSHCWGIQNSKWLVDFATFYTETAVPYKRLYMIILCNIQFYTKCVYIFIIYYICVPLLLLFASTYLKFFDKSPYGAWYHKFDDFESIYWYHL